MGNAAIALPALCVGLPRPAPHGFSAHVLRREGEGALQGHEMLWGQKCVP